MIFSLRDLPQITQIASPHGVTFGLHIPSNIFLHSRKVPSPAPQFNAWTITLTATLATFAVRFALNHNSKAFFIGTALRSVALVRSFFSDQMHQHFLEDQPYNLRLFKTDEHRPWEIQLNEKNQLVTQLPDSIEPILLSYFEGSFYATNDKLFEEPFEFHKKAHPLKLKPLSQAQTLKLRYGKAPHANYTPLQKLTRTRYGQPLVCFEYNNKIFSLNLRGLASNPIPGEKIAYSLKLGCTISYHFDSEQKNYIFDAPSELARTELEKSSDYKKCDTLRYFDLKQQSISHVYKGNLYNLTVLLTGGENKEALVSDLFGGWHPCTYDNKGKIETPLTLEESLEKSEVVINSPLLKKAAEQKDLGQPHMAEKPDEISFSEITEREGVVGFYMQGFDENRETHAWWTPVRWSPSEEVMRLFAYMHAHSCITIQLKENKLHAKGDASLMKCLI